MTGAYKDFTLNEMVVRLANKIGFQIGRSSWMITSLTKSAHLDDH